jgi:selenocysteine-specific elongation factor
LPKVGKVSIVDVPGHEKFIHNMLVGALGIDVALLCVAADAGVMPQTREHVDILRLLPVHRMVVALTRADLADAETRELAIEEVRELLDKARFAGAQIIPVSAITGEGLPDLRQALVEALQHAEEFRGGPWYLPIDRAFAVKGHGTVVTGTLAQGRVKVGDRAYLEPGHWEVRVRSIHSHGDQLETSEHGKRTALNLGGVRLEDVRRGMTVGEPGASFQTSCIDAQVEWLVEPKHGQRVRVSIGADEAMGKAFLNTHDPTLVQLRLEQPVAAALHQPLIIRRYSPMSLLGGGKVLVPQAKVRRKSEAASLVRSTDDPEAILEALGSSPDGLMTEELCRLLGKTPQLLGEVFEKLAADGALFGFGGRWISAAGFAAAKAKLLATLGSLHEANPMLALHPRERVAAQAGLSWAGKPLERFLAALVQSGDLVVEGNGIRAAGFRLALSDKQRAFLERVKAELFAAGVNVPFISDLAHTLHVPQQAVDEILRLGVQAREIVRVEEGIYYTDAQIEQFKGIVKNLPSPFAASDLRDATNSSRKYVIPLLEHFDAIGFTLRQGDRRVVR